MNLEHRVRRTHSLPLRAAALAVALLPLGALAAATPPEAAAKGSAADTAAKVAAAAEGKRPEARIPFADHGGIWNWQVVDRDTLLIQGRDRRWYKAELMGPCIDLPFAQALGFKSNPTGDFDQFSSVIVRGQECRLHSLTETAAPATSRGRHSTKDAPPAKGSAPAPAKSPQ